MYIAWDVGRGRGSKSRIVHGVVDLIEGNISCSESDVEMMVGPCGVATADWDVAQDRSPVSAMTHVIQPEGDACRLAAEVGTDVETVK